jgi:hypothetical protein
LRVLLSSRHAAQLVAAATRRLLEETPEILAEAMASPDEHEHR